MKQLVLAFVGLWCCALFAVGFPAHENATAVRILGTGFNPRVVVVVATTIDEPFMQAKGAP